MITIRYGVNSVQRDEFVGRTPQDVINELGDALNIPTGVSVKVDGHTADMDQRLHDRQTVEFVKAQGEKGLAA